MTEQNSIEKQLNELDITFAQKKSLYKVFSVANLNPENLRSVDLKQPILKADTEDDYTYINLHLSNSPKTSFSDSLRDDGEVRIKSVRFGDYSTSITLRVGREEDELLDVTIFFGKVEDIEEGEE